MRCYWENLEELHIGDLKNILGTPWEQTKRNQKNHPPPPNQNPKEQVPKGINVAVPDLIVSTGWDLGCILSQLEPISLQVMSLEDAAESSADISAEQEFVGSNLRFFACELA
jgi:hypothetical protein